MPTLDEMMRRASGPKTLHDIMQSGQSTPAPAVNVGDVPGAFRRGYNRSSLPVLYGSGLSKEERDAYDQASAEQPWYDEILEGLGTLAGDIIPGFAGYSVGKPIAKLASWWTGGPVSEGVSNVAGGAMAFAVPQTIKAAWDEYATLKALPEYANMSMEEVILKVSKEGVVEGAKGAATGALVTIAPWLSTLKKIPGVGKMLTTKAMTAAGEKEVLTTLGRMTQSELGKIGIQAGAMTLGSAALDLRMPNSKEFALNAALMTLIHNALRVPSIAARAKSLKGKGINAEEKLQEANIQAKSQADYDLKAARYLEALEKEEQAKADKIEAEAKAREEKITTEAERRSEETPERVRELREKEREATRKAEQKTADAEAKAESIKADRTANAVRTAAEDIAHHAKDSEHRKAMVEKSLELEKKRINQLAEERKRSAREQFGSDSKASKKAIDAIERQRDHDIQRAIKAAEKAEHSIDAAKDPIWRKITSETKKLSTESTKVADTALKGFEKAARDINTRLFNDTLSIHSKAQAEVQKLTRDSAADQKLESKIKRIEEKAEREVAAKAAQAEAQLNRISKRLESSLAKTEAKLQDAIKRAEVASEKHLERNKSKAQADLIETLDSIRNKMRRSVERSKKLVEVWKKDRLESLQKKTAERLEKQKQKSAETIDNAKAQVAAGKARGFIQVPAHMVGMGPAPKAGQRPKMVTLRYVNRTAAQAGMTPHQVAASVISPVRTTLMRPIKYVMNWLEAGLFHDLAILKSYIPKESFRKVEQSLEKARNYESAARYAIEEGIVDIRTGQIMHDGAVKILKKFFGDEKVDVDLLDQYMAAQASLNRQALGQKNPFPTQDALALVNDGSVYAKAAKEMSNMFNATLEQAYQEGIISKESRDAMLRDHQDYAPLQRDVAALEGPNAAPSGLLPERVFRRARGGDKHKILSPFMVGIENVIRLQRAIQKNQAIRDLAKALPEVTDPHLANAKNSTIKWYDNGKLMEKVVEPDIAALVRSLDKQQLKGLEKLISKARKLHSQAVTTFPTDIIRLTGLDLLQSTIQTKHSIPKYFSAIFETIGDSVFRKGLYLDYLKDGGVRQAMADVSRSKESRYMADTFANALNKRDPAAIAALKGFVDLVKAPMRLLNDVSGRLGDIPRLAEYKLSKEKGGGLEISDAYEVSTPYGREGNFRAIQFLNNMMPFARTTMTSTHTFMKNIDPTTAHGRRVIRRAATLLTAPTIYFYLANRDDPRYQREPQNVRDEYILIYRKSYLDDPNEEPIRIRKLWQFGWLFQTLPEKMTEYAITKDPESFNGLMRSFEYNFSNLTIANLSDSVKEGYFDPDRLLEGRYGVVPKSQEKIDPELRQTDLTSETAKWLGKNIGVLDALHWDHVFQAVGARFGKKALELSDEILIAAGIAPDTKVGKDMADDIFIGSFFGRGVGKTSEYSKRFYDLFKQQEMRNATYNEYIKQGKIAEAEDYIKRKPIVPMKLLNKMRTNLSRYRQMISEIEGRVNVTRADRDKKRNEIRQIEQEMHELARIYLNELEEALSG